ncbi:MAG: hypothetical protein K6A35_10485 [bacterium]|nr:hypothetical protein [bacterium]
MNGIDVNKLIKDLRHSELYRQCRLPLEYSEGLPMLEKVGQRVLLQIPYLCYRITGQKDRTLVYPLRYLITLELPSGKMVRFADLSLEVRFAKVDFARPVGLFRHEAVRHLNRAQYRQQRSELLKLYGVIAQALLEGNEPGAQHVQQMSDLLKMLLEPSLWPMYVVINEDFCQRFGLL